jgi:chemotaxis protein CheD
VEARIIQQKPQFRGDKDIHEEQELLYVGIGEIKLGKSGDILRIASLGSCIGLCIYVKDKKPNLAVMGHIMLPESPKHNNKTKKTKIKARFPPTRYADIAIPAMIEQLEKVAKFRRKSFVAKMIGGAEMFGYTKLTIRIGEENAKKTKELLEKEGIPLVKEFTGGDTGMAVSFSVKDYVLTVKPTGGKPIEI